MSYTSWKYAAASYREHLETAVRKLKYINQGFDAVILHGTSGTWLAGGLLLAGFDVCMLHKEGENSHGMVFEYNLDKPAPKRVVFVDDFTMSGTTKEHVISQGSRYGYEVVACVYHSNVY